MPSFDKIRRIFKREAKNESPKDKEIKSLQARIKELEKERDDLLKVPSYESGSPRRQELNPRIERINQEIENLHREIEGLPPLLFNDSKRPY